MKNQDNERSSHCLPDRSMACRAISEENEMGRQQGIQESRELLTAFLGSVPEVREHVATEKGG
jgi:hypothetical protein